MTGRIFAQSFFIGITLAVAGAAWAGPEADLQSETATMDRWAASQPASRVTHRFAADFVAFTGSQDNAEALVSGLRSGTPITLTDVTAAGATPVTITPPTRPMGYGNAYISLSLAKAQLAQYGISTPTPEELKAALTGGSLTVTQVGADGTVSTQTINLEGILNQRAAGQGWGEIAQANGFKLGPVVSSIKAANHQLASGAASASADVSGSRVSSRGHAYGQGITTAVSGGGVVYGKRQAHLDGRVTIAEGASPRSVSEGRMGPVGLASAGAAPGKSANAPGHTKAR